MIPIEVSGSRLPGRLVGEQQRRVVDERAAHRDALLLAARELVGEVVQLGRQARERRMSGTLARKSRRRPP
jgi:hypothetical protein